MNSAKRRPPGGQKEGSESKKNLGDHCFTY